MPMFMIDLGAQSHYSVLGIGPDAEAKEIRDSQSRIVGDLKRKLGMARGSEEKRVIEERLKNINSIGDELSRPKSRQAYDARNAHLTFFVVRKAVAPILEDRELRLRWVHKAVRDFLIQKGETMEPLADLERTDFSADFSPNQMLDAILLSGRRG
jgi:hypothetical protein